MARLNLRNFLKWTCRDTLYILSRAKTSIALITAISLILCWFMTIKFHQRKNGWIFTYAISTCSHFWSPVRIGLKRISDCQNTFCLFVLLECYETMCMCHHVTVGLKSSPRDLVLQNTALPKGIRASTWFGPGTSRFIRDHCSTTEPARLQ